MNAAFYFSTFANGGPISVRSDVAAEDGERAAIDVFCPPSSAYINDARTDAEDDLGFDGEGMDPAAFETAMEAHGFAAYQRGVYPTLDSYGWTLWSSGLSVGDRVEIGEEGSDRFDRGYVLGHEAGGVRVSWDVGGVETVEPADNIRRV